MRASAGETRVDADGRVELRVGRAHDGGHCAAGRQSSHIDLTRVDTVAIHDFARHAGEDCRLALVSALVAALKPVPAPRTVGSTGLLGIENKTLPLLGERVHTGAVCKVVGCLRATVQHHNKGERLSRVGRRDVELVGACPGLIGIGPGDELSRLPVNHRRLGTRHVGDGVAVAPATQKPLRGRSAGIVSSPAALRSGVRSRFAGSATSENSTSITSLLAPPSRSDAWRSAPSAAAELCRRMR